VGRIILFAVATALTVGSGVAAPAPTQVEPGLMGKVLRGPTTPVCRADRPCYAPFKGTLVFTPLKPGVTTGPVRTQSQADGDYRVSLDPMRYRVTTGLRSRFGGLVQPAVVTVPASGMRRVNFVVDTGIR
jgi:hypothetical protein